MLFRALLMLFAALPLQSAAQLFVPFSSFDSLIRQNQSQLNAKLILVNEREDNFEALFSGGSNQLFRFNLYPLKHCGSLPGNADTLRMGDSLTVFRLRTNLLSYLQMPNSRASCCIQLTTDARLADSILFGLMQHSGLMALEARKVEWPERIAAPCRLDGTLLRTLVLPCEIEGFHSEIRVTMRNDSLLHASLQMLENQYGENPNYIETPDAVLTFRHGTICDFLSRKMDGQPVVFSYYVRK